MKFLVLGASGFLGNYLGYYLTSNGHHVVGVSKSNSNSYKNFILVHDMEDYENVIDRFKPDVVINAVAVTSHELCEQRSDHAYLINSTCAGCWAKAAKNAGSIFVQISTDAVFDGNSNELYLESDNSLPNSVYGKSKLKGEDLVAKEYSESLIIRTNFFGWSPKGNRGILDFFIKNFSDKNPITGFCDYFVSSMYVGDLCDVMLALINMQTHGIYHVASTTTSSKYEFGLAVGLNFGFETKCMTPGYLDDVLTLSPRGKNLGLATFKAADAIGMPIPDLTTSLKRAREEKSAIMSWYNSVPS